MADSEGAVAPAEPASDAPPPAGWRIGGFAVAGGLVVSTIIHLLLVGTALFVGPPLLQSEPATAVTVDLVTPEELAAMSDKAAEPDKPQPAAAAPAQPPAEPAQSQPPVSAVASASEAFAMPFLPPPAPPSAPAPPDPKIGQAAQLAQLVGVPSVTDLSGGGPSDFKADLTPEEIAAFAAHVQSCWSAPAGLAQSPKLYVVMRVSLRRDGGLASEPLPIAGSASAEGPALAQSAKRALQQCQPHDALPAAKYDEWRLLDLRFTGSGITTASPVSHGPRTPRSG
jgi:hypothetical protein